MIGASIAVPVVAVVMTMVATEALLDVGDDAGIDRLGRGLTGEGKANKTCQDGQG